MIVVDILSVGIFHWILLSAFAMLTGYLIVQYMVRSLNLYGIYGIFLTISAGCYIFFLVNAFMDSSMKYAPMLTLVLVFVGYVIANAVFLAQDEVHDLPAVTRTDGGDGHTAILYFTHGEPRGYDPLPWILTMGELDHDNVPFVPWLARPFFFNALRAAYLEAGGSPHNDLHRTYIDNLRHAMPQAVTDGTRFYLAFLDTAPHPGEMAIKAINEGASKIIVLPIFVTESTHTIAGQEMVDKVNPQQYGVEVSYAGAIGKYDSLHRVFVDRANDMSIDMDKSDVGILLVGHGQPDEWEELYPEQNLQESQYRSSIRDKLIADGFSSEKVILCWMSFQDPTITESVKVLEENGVKKILAFSVSLSALAIHSEIDVPKAVKAAELPATIEVEYVGQYGDHPMAIQAMVEAIMAAP